MLNRHPNPSNCKTAPSENCVAELLRRLREGVEAMSNPAVETKVQAYFERHPKYSRDLIHVAAVACRLQAAEQRTDTPTQSTNHTAAVTPRI